MPFAPMAAGHGGSQRAWHLLHALAQQGPVDLVLLQQPAYWPAGVDLEPVRAVARSVTCVALHDWDPAARRWPAVPRRVGRWIDLVRMGSVHAPRLGRRALRDLAQRLPVRHAPRLFAGRLAAATIVDQLITSGLLAADRKVVDFDDVQSRFQERESRQVPRLAVDVRAMERLQLGLIRRAEAAVARGWQALGVCSDEDVALLRRAWPRTPVYKVPNVIDRPLIPPPAGSETFVLLFVGNLSFGPNVHGLMRFVSEAWPRVVAGHPAIRLRVVGLSPPAALAADLKAAGIELHADVPAVEPFYAEADAVIAPIFFGGGTRIKILEAMAYGRPVISTTIGIEGLDAIPGTHAMVADDMAAFAQAVLSLAASPDRRRAMAAAARSLQQQRFGPAAMDRAVREICAAGG